MEPAVDRAYERACLVAGVLRQRFQVYLFEFGGPSTGSADPRTARVVLRGHELEAELLRTYDEEVWVWSWADSSLALNDDQTTIARNLRSAAARLSVDAFEAPRIATRNRRVPFLFGGLAVAHGFADAFVVAGPQIYAVRPGQVSLSGPAMVDEIMGAEASIRRYRYRFDWEYALEFAAKPLQLELKVGPHEIEVRDADGVTMSFRKDDYRQCEEDHYEADTVIDKISVEGAVRRPPSVAPPVRDLTVWPPKAPNPFVWIANCFTSKQHSVDEIIERLKADPNLAHLRVTCRGDHFVLTGEHVFVRISRTERLKHILAEAKATGAGAEARSCGALLRVDAFMTEGYRGMKMSAGDTEPYPNEALVAAAVLRKLNHAVVYDAILRRWLPR